MISKRLRESLDSSICIRDIFEEGKKLAAIYGAENIFNFTIGNPSVEPPAAVNEALKEIIDTEKPLALHGYPANVGHPEVRNHIANYLNGKYDCNYTEQGIIMTSGAAAAIVVIANTLLDDGDEVVTFAPYFWEYKSYVETMYGKLVPALCNMETLQPDPETFEAALSPKTRFVLINTPNNPTGAVYTKEQLTELAELACKHDFYIISDEVYEKLIYEGKKHFCVASISEEVKDRTVVINGVSKAYSMTGWRVGYAAGNAALIKGMTSLQGHTTSNTCSIAQYAALEAISGPQDSVESMRVEFDKRRKFLVERLNSMDGITCNNADGAFYLMPNMTAFYDKEWNGKKIADSFGMADYLLAEAKIAVVPGGAFESPDNIRIAYSNSMESLIEGMNRMEAALKKLG